MKLLVNLTISLCLLACINSNAQKQQIRVIPYPENVQVTKGVLKYTSISEISYSSNELKDEAEYLCEQLKVKFNISTGLVNQAKSLKKGISLSIDASLKNKEAYKLNINSKNVIIEGGSDAGVFYGIQTLLQTMTNGEAACGTITDEPRYEWRGYMLDEARHFSGEKRVKELLDLMAYYKMNRFHWHLTDAQGWRIEIKQYPRLATIGGIGSHSNPDAPCTYYTQEQIRDIVSYAKARHIEIIPEVDMPGHATASNHAYPEYNGGGTEEHPDFTFNVGKEETYTFLSNVLRELAGLFPSKYMHIGGDEVAYGIQAWETDKYVQDLLKREGLKNVKEAERYFMHRMMDTVHSLGKILVGWDELLDLNVNKNNTVIMWWRHDKPNYLKTSLSKGYTTILCPRKPLYFDFVQHDSHKVGRIWDGFCPLEDVYAFPDKWIKGWGVTPEEMTHVLGIQANSWSELMHNKQRVDFMTFPRLCALAEAAWSKPEVKDYQGFKERLNDAYKLFDKLNIYYFDERDANHHLEPAGPIIIKKKPQPMNYRD